MESFAMQVTLQLGLEDRTEIGYRPVTLDEAIRGARHTAEAIADSSGATIVNTVVIHTPSGSGESDFYDLDGKEIDG